MSETDLKNLIKDYLNIRHIFNYHIQQGMGSYAGLPDRVMHYVGVVYLEIKTPKGKLSPAQEKFQAQCAEDCIPYFVIRSLEDLQAIVG